MLPEESLCSYAYAYMDLHARFCLNNKYTMSARKKW